MKTTAGLLFIICLSLTSCTAFKQNIEDDKRSSSINSLNERQMADVNAFSEGGQINAYEKAAMEQSISGAN
jgi:starvation-inducible outer membrane lipoprotein